MMLIANRLRGTYGWFASVFGVAITIVLYLLTKDLTAALLLGVVPAVVALAILSLGWPIADVLEPYVVAPSTLSRVFAGRDDTVCLRFKDRAEWLALGYEHVEEA